MNRRTLILACVALGTVSSVSSAQGAVAETRSLWAETMRNVIEAAKDMPEAKYGYRPIATVRTFGELIGHVAGSQDRTRPEAAGRGCRREGGHDQGRAGCRAREVEQVVRRCLRVERCGDDR